MFHHFLVQVHHLYALYFLIPMFVLLRSSSFSHILLKLNLLNSSVIHLHMFLCPFIILYIDVLVNHLKSGARICLIIPVIIVLYLYKILYHCRLQHTKCMKMRLSWSLFLSFCNSLLYHSTTISNMSLMLLLRIIISSKFLLE